VLSLFSSPQRKITVANKRQKLWQFDGGFHLRNSDGSHHNRDNRAIARASLGSVDVVHNVHARSDLAEHGMLRRSGAIEEIEEAVVNRVDEELGASGLGLAGVSHGEGSGLVAEARAVLVLELIGDRAGRITGDGSLARDLVSGSRLGATSSSTAARGVTAVGASELVHEVGDNAVEGEAVVESLLREIDKVVRRNRHSSSKRGRLGVQLNGERTHGGHASGNFVRHSSGRGRFKQLPQMIRNVCSSYHTTSTKDMRFAHNEQREGCKRE
jgi:hypothetical protein